MKRALAALAFLAGPALGLDSTRSLLEHRLDIWSDALPQNTVHCILQTRDGYIWIGTYEGLVRFDGVRFTVFDPRTTPEVPSRGVMDIREDPGGTLWIATENGLVSRAAGRFHRHGPESGLLPNRISRILADSAGRIWVGTERGLYVRQAGRGAFERHGAIPLTSEVLALCEDATGAIWVSTPEALLRVTDVETRTILSGRQLGGRLSVLCRRGAGGVYVGYESGGVLVTDGEGTPRPLEGADRISEVNVILEDPHEPATGGDSQPRVWIGTTTTGLHAVRGDRIERLGIREGLTNNQVRSLAFDREGSLWIGTNLGLARLRASRFTFFGQYLLPNPNVRSVLQDDRGALWIGTEGGGVARFETADPSSPMRTALSGESARALWTDGDGGVFVGTDRGVRHLLADGGEGAALTTREGLPLPSINALISYRGDLWIGTYGAGLARRRGDRIDVFTRESGLPTNLVRSLHVDRAGTLWVGTSGGLARLRDERFEEVFPGPGVFSFHEEPDGTLWIGTSNGVYRRRGERIDRAGEKEGLFDGYVFTILEDYFGTFWLSSNRGIQTLVKGDFEAFVAGRIPQVPSTAYPRVDGMVSQCNGGTQPAGIRLTDGRLCFATIGGLLVVDPRRTSTNMLPPPVHIEDVRLDGRSVGDGRAGVRVPRDLERIEIDYTALSLLAPGRVRFRYRLEPADTRWTDAGTRRTAYYTNIPPGDHVFRVIGCNNDGVWNQEGASLRLAVPTPLWRTWWALLAYGLSALALGWAVVHIRVVALRRHTRELEAKVMERTAELARSEQRALEASRAKGSFLASMSHELRTPLNAILGFAQLMRRRPGRDPEDTEHLGIVSRSGEHLLSLINDILSLARIEAGRLELSRVAFDPRRLLADVGDMLRERARAKGLELSVEEAGFPSLVSGDEGKLRQVLINLVGNALKFTAEGSVRLRAEWGQGRATFEVRDSGAGIAPDELRKLFEPFVQSSTGRRAAEGTGLGLAISRSLVSAMGGEITAESEPGRGTTFRFEIPLPRGEEAGRARTDQRVLALSPGQARRLVLVADDAVESRLLLVELLTGTGFTVWEASDGVEALETWERFEPDLVLLDVHMPRLDGLAAARRIREREKEGARVDALPTVLLAISATAFEADREAALAAGCEGFIAKPFRVEELLERIGHHLGLRFERATVSEPSTGAGGSAPEGNRTWELPPPLVAELAGAAEGGDREKGLRLLERVRELDPDAFGVLEPLMRSFRFDEVQAVLEKRVAR